MPENTEYSPTKRHRNYSTFTISVQLTPVDCTQKPTKCEYLKPELEYLVHIITKDGVKPDKEKIEKILNFRELKTIGEKDNN